MLMNSTRFDLFIISKFLRSFIISCTLCLLYRLIEDLISKWHYIQSSKIVDTTAAQARRGVDIQGIPWERLSITREKYRKTRLEQYKNYENIPNSGEGSEKVNDPSKPMFIHPRVVSYVFLLFILMFCLWFFNVI